MKQKRRNAFWTFIFSFMPGCAEMYWGYMKMGMSLLVPFTLIAAISILFRFEIILLLDVVVYIYAFFHARNLAHLTEEELADVPDEPVKLMDGMTNPIDFINKKKLTGWIGFLLIVSGIYIALDQCKYLFYDYVYDYTDYTYNIYCSILDLIPQCILAGVVIRLGIALIAGKKKKAENETEETDESSTNNTEA